MITDTPLLLAEKITAAVSLGLLIGLEREWARKEAGVRSFAIASLLGMLSWLVSPTLALVQVGIIVILIIAANVYSLYKGEQLLITTSLALAVTNILGILVGMGEFFIAFACAIVVTALLSWKTEFEESGGRGERRRRKQAEKGECECVGIRFNRLHFDFDHRIVIPV